jgi:hypothetical protein
MRISYSEDLAILRLKESFHFMPYHILEMYAFRGDLIMFNRLISEFQTQLVIILCALNKVFYSGK